MAVVITAVIVLHVFAVPSQLPSPVVCMCCHYKHSHLALLVCVGNAVVITFSYGLYGQGTIIRVASLHCCCVLAVNLQLPPCIACMCWQYSRSHVLVLHVCVGNAIPVAFAHRLHVLSL